MADGLLINIVRLLSGALINPTIRYVKGPVKLRSDSTLAEDLAQFRANGSNIKRAKFYNNVIREPLFQIGLAQV